MQIQSNRKKPESVALTTPRHRFLKINPWILFQRHIQLYSTYYKHEFQSHTESERGCKRGGGDCQETHSGSCAFRCLFLSYTRKLGIARSMEIDSIGYLLFCVASLAMETSRSQDHSESDPRHSNHCWNVHDSIRPAGSYYGIYSRTTGCSFRCNPYSF